MSKEVHVATIDGDDGETLSFHRTNEPDAKVRITATREDNLVAFDVEPAVLLLAAKTVAEDFE